MKIAEMEIAVVFMHEAEELMENTIMIMKEKVMNMKEETIMNMRRKVDHHARPHKAAFKLYEFGVSGHIKKIQTCLFFGKTYLECAARKTVRVAAYRQAEAATRAAMPHSSRR